MMWVMWWEGEFEPDPRFVCSIMLHRNMVEIGGIRLVIVRVMMEGSNKENLDLEYLFCLVTWIVIIWNAKIIWSCDMIMKYKNVMIDDDNLGLWEYYGVL